MSELPKKKEKKRKEERITTSKYLAYNKYQEKINPYFGNWMFHQKHVRI